MKTFMDACDELGLLVTDAILGWQYYSRDPDFQQQFSIVSSYPNPFYSSTTISFSVNQSLPFVNLEIYNIKGQKIKQFKIENSKLKKKGKVIWDGTDANGNSVVSGVYLYRFETKYESECGKLILLK